MCRIGEDTKQLDEFLPMIKSYNTPEIQWEKYLNINEDWVKYSPQLFSELESEESRLADIAKIAKIVYKVDGETNPPPPPPPPQKRHKNIKKHRGYMHGSGAKFTNKHGINLSIK